MSQYHDDEAYLMGDEPSREDESPRRRRRMEPHRASTVFVMGILGLLVCFICGIFAWSWGNEDLRKIRAGTMDPDGRGLTEAGRILGMISVILSLGALVLVGLVMCLGAGAATYSSY